MHANMSAYIHTDINAYIRNYYSITYFPNCYVTVTSPGITMIGWMCYPADPIKAGNIFSGTSHWSGCLSREDHVTRITITGSKRRKFFKPRVWLTARVESELHDHGHNVSYHHGRPQVGCKFSRRAPLEN